MSKVLAAIVAALLVTVGLMGSFIAIGADIGIEVGASIGAILFVGVASTVLITDG